MKNVIDPFTGKDITAQAAALSERLVKANRAYHAQKAPGCETWERYAIPAYENRKRTGMLDGIGCEAHGVFLSWGADEPMPA